MKLYALDDGPPSIACRMVLKALDLEWENVPVDYNGGEHLGEEYAKVFFFHFFFFCSTLWITNCNPVSSKSLNINVVL